MLDPTLFAADLEPYRQGGGFMGNVMVAMFLIWAAIKWRSVRVILVILVVLVPLCKIAIITLGSDSRRTYAPAVTPVAKPAPQPSR